MRRIYDPNSESVYRARRVVTGIRTGNSYTMLYGPYQTLSATKACITRAFFSSSPHETSTWTIEVASEWSAIDG